MNQIDLSFFLDPPLLQASALLKIEALAPLSIVPYQPGTYYRSQVIPTTHMLYGMLENAMGWHFSEQERTEILKGLRKALKKKYSKDSTWKESDWLMGQPTKSGSDFMSLLSYHVKITTSFHPAVLEYDDYWSQHLRDTGANFIGGSRHYDAYLEELINRSLAEDISQPENPRTKKHLPFVEFGEKAGIHQILSIESAKEKERGQLHYKSVRNAFPTYYVSPKRRGYVVLQKPYLFRVETTQTLAEMIERALADPAAPLYLGSNDGWVEATWEWL